MLALVATSVLALACSIPSAEAALSWGRARIAFDDQKAHNTFRRGSGPRSQHVTADAAADHVDYLPGYNQESAFDMYAG